MYGAYTAAVFCTFFLPFRREATFSAVLLRLLSGPRKESVQRDLCGMGERVSEYIYMHVHIQATPHVRLSAVVLEERSNAVEMKETWPTELSPKTCVRTREVETQRSLGGCKKNMLVVVKRSLSIPRSQVEASMTPLDKNIKGSLVHNGYMCNQKLLTTSYNVTAIYEPWT